MEFDIASFLKVLIGNIKDKQLPIEYYMIMLAVLLAFFVIKYFLLQKDGTTKENKRSRIYQFIFDLVISWAISIATLFMVENMLVSIILGIIATPYVSSKLSERTKKKDDKEETQENKEKHDTNVSVIVNNNIETEKDEKLLPDFYDPGEIKLPNDIKSFNELNIIMILEIYGYISPNQKFKMITQSLFETTDEQVEKLLHMYVLNEKELKEARAILNLIKLNNRLISKEEAIQCIIELENKQKNSEREGG